MKVVILKIRRYFWSSGNEAHQEHNLKYHFDYQYGSKCSFEEYEFLDVKFDSGYFYYFFKKK